jgi:histidine triad (HIT) family protein
MKAESVNTCLFCRIVRGELTPGVLAYHDNQTAVFPSRLQQPRNQGHMLVVPTRHVEQIYGIDGELAGPLMMTVARVAAAVKIVHSADGISIRQNNDPAGDQDVFHIHFHVVPRFEGDGFTGLDRSLGAVEVTLEERIDQARKVAEAMGQLR